jgi:hypothetical protein
MEYTSVEYTVTFARMSRMRQINSLENYPKFYIYFSVLPDESWCCIDVAGQLDLRDKRFSPENEFRVSMTLDALRKENNENMIVNGELLVLDMTGYSAKHVARSTLDSNRDSFKVYQVTRRNLQFCEDSNMYCMAWSVCLNSCVM